jgi:FixJ family two-component response regulator
MNTSRPLISVVDDDESVRAALPLLLKTFGLRVKTFSSAEDFLSSEHMDATTCLFLDIAMPKMTGPELQRELNRRGAEIPIVFITAVKDEAVRQNLIEDGAVECLFKPFSETELEQALRCALATS